MQLTTSRFVENYTQERISDLKYILKYLNRNIKGIEYKRNGNVKLLEAYSDADSNFVLGVQLCFRRFFQNSRLYCKKLVIHL